MGRFQLLSALFVLTVILQTEMANSQARFLGVINVPFPSQMNIFTHSGTNPVRKYSVLVSSCNPERSTFDSTFMLQYPGEQIAANFSGYTPKNLFNFNSCGHEVQQVPNSIIGTEAVIQFDGSPISGKSGGSVFLTDMTDYNFPATYDLATTVVPESFMYANGFWRNIDLIDNREDLMTCRVQLLNDQPRYAQLVWLEHARDDFRDRWNIHILKESACDTNLAFTSIQQGLFDEYEVIYATGLYTQRLTFFYTTGPVFNWDQPDAIETAVLETGRQYYDVTLVDVNRDGNLDILFTVVAQTGGSVEVYEIPTNDFRVVANYRKHVIATGFDSRNGGTLGRSPGIARAFHSTASTGQKPWIMVAGADDGRAYYLRPTSQTATDWNYEKIVVRDMGPNQNVGGVAVADINGNGGKEMFVSANLASQVHVFTFDP